MLLRPDVQETVPPLVIYVSKANKLVKSPEADRHGPAFRPAMPACYCRQLRKPYAIKDFGPETRLTLARFFPAVTMPPDFDPPPKERSLVMRSLLAFSLLIVLATCQISAAQPAEGQSYPSAPVSGEGTPFFISPSIPVVLVRGYEESLGDASSENALSEEEQQEFLVDFQATMAVKQAKIDLLRMIHQLETVEKKCKGTPAGDEAAELLKLLPQRKVLQPGQLTKASAARKKATVASRNQVTSPAATTVK
jgi:hypothetical protein